VTDASRGESSSDGIKLAGECLGLDERSPRQQPPQELPIFVCAGAFLFAFGFFLFLTAIQLGGVRLDPSFLSFYPPMAVILVIFGFERWRSYESGGVNPFHDG
jgi:drug/metabolite transporter (DMT)-like permease